MRFPNIREEEQLASISSDTELSASSVSSISETATQAHKIKLMPAH